MGNVITMRTSVPMYRQTNLRIVEQYKKKIDFNLLKFFRKTYENYCKHLDDIKKKKIEELKKAAYDFYLDYYLTHTKGTVDIHEELYRKRITLCSFASDMADRIVMQRVEEGKLDKCYKALQKMKKRKSAIKKGIVTYAKRKSERI